MKKVKEFSKRSFCILLVSITLSLTVVSDYYGARHCEAAEAAGFMGLVESLLLSLGLSCQSTKDLKTFSDACHYNFYETLTPEEIEQMETMTFSDVIDVGKEEVANTWNKLKSKVKNLVNKVNVSKNKDAVTVPNISDTSFNLQMQYGILSESSLRSVWNNLPIQGNVTTPFASEVTNSGFCFVGKKIDWNTGSMTFRVIYPNYDLTDSDCYYYLQYDGNTFEICYKNSGKIEKTSKLLKSFVFTKSTADAEYLDKTLGETLYTNGTTLEFYGQNYFGYSSKSYSFGEVLSSFDDTWSFCMYSAVPIYESYKDFVTTNNAATTFPLAGKIYGNKSITMDDSKPFSPTDGSTTQAIEEAINAAMEANPSITTDEINDIVSGCITEMTDIEDAIEDGNQTAVVGNTWLEKIFKKVDSALDIDLSGIASKITTFDSNVKSKFSSLSKTVTSGLNDVVYAVGNLDLDVDLSSVISGQTSANTFLSSLVDGTSALKEDVEDIADQFTVIEGGGGNQSPEEDPNESIDVWIPIIPTVITILKPLLEFLGTPLSIVTRHLNTLKNTLEDIHVGWQKWIKGTYDNATGIFTQQMPQILSHLNTLVQYAASLSGTLSASFAQAMTETLPDLFSQIEIAPIPLELPETWPEGWPELDPIEFPESINYTNILQQILLAIQSIFSLDTPVIEEAVDDLDTAVNDVVPDLPDFPALFNLKFTNDINYPVFKMKTPDILKTAGYDQDYVILLDTQEYVTYIVWIRKFLRCAIWLMFAYAVLCHFKVDLNVE